MRHIALLGLAAGLLGCPPENPPPPPPPPPPQVFLTSVESMIIGTSISLSTTVSGCKAVTQVQILVNNAFVADANYTRNPTAVTLQASQLNRFYSDVGLATPLTLTAKVVCDDGRTNTSQPLGLTFFPVDSVFSVSASQALPDTFIAEGGLGGTPTTFLGCVGSTSGTVLARVSLQGEITAYNESLPFNCTATSEITDRSAATGTRWLFEPGKGAFAFDSGLNITAVLNGSYKQIGVAPNGDAVLWDDTITQERIVVANARGGGAPIRWQDSILGIMNSKPVVNQGLRVLWATTWQFDFGTRVGNVVVHQFNLDTGQRLQSPPLVVVQQNFDKFNEPIMPSGSFNADGSLFYVPLLTADATGKISSAVLACATNASGCQGSARRWISRFFDGIISVALPFARDGYVAAAGPYQAWFLSGATGEVKNLGGEPLRPDGSLIVQGLQPGLGSDFYVLTGPYVAGVTTWPVEIIATDMPESGELWRLQKGGGDSPVGGLWLAVDEGGLPWMRVGPDQVKPLTNAAYRLVRGPTPTP